MRALGLSAEDYVVFGSAPMLAHSLIAQVGDIDILAAGSAWQLTQELDPPVLAPNGNWMVQVAPDIDIYNVWLGLDADAVIRHAELLDGLPIARPEDVAVYKRFLNRPKDRLHLKLLEPYLAACR